MVLRIALATVAVIGLGSTAQAQGCRGGAGGTSSGSLSGLGYPAGGAALMSNGAGYSGNLAMAAAMNGSFNNPMMSMGNGYNPYYAMAIANGMYGGYGMMPWGGGYGGFNNGYAMGPMYAANNGVTPSVFTASLADDIAPRARTNARKSKVRVRKTKTRGRSG
jgi:hypothetical protein